MADQRITKLARVLVQYSLGIKPHDLFRINASPLAAPLIREVYREAIQAGANPFVRLTIDGLDEVLYKYGSDEQVTFVADLARQEVEAIDATLAIIGGENSRALSGADPGKVARRRQAGRPLQERVMQRAEEGALNWCVTLFPTNSGAQDADMSLSDYEDFVYAACKVDLDDPIAAWQQTRDEQQHIADFLNGVDEVRLVSRETDLTYRVAGRSWVNCFGDKNFPDGEVFSGPHEASANGTIHYTFPAIYMGREVSDIRLWFENGNVVKATAGKGEDLLHKLLDMDEGARRLGEVAFGTNYGIQRYSRNILFDEKIGGTVHLALGAGYAETGSTNHSALHWDMVCDMRDGGEAYADGKLFYKNGAFLI